MRADACSYPPQDIFEETPDKDRFVGDVMFWKFFEDIDANRIYHTNSVEYRTGFSVPERLSSGLLFVDLALHSCGWPEELESHVFRDTLLSGLVASWPAKKAKLRCS